MQKIDKKYKKDYKNLKYKNPRLAKEKEQRVKKFNTSIKVLISLVVLSVVYFLFFSPFFQIRETNYDGLKRVKHENLSRIVDEYRYKNVFLVFSKNNFWFFNSSNVQQLIENSYRFDDLQVKKKWPNKLEIVIAEKEPEISWLTENYCFHVDNTGLAIEYCEGERDYIKVKDLNNKPAEIGKSVIDQSFIDYIINLNGNILSLTTDIKISPTLYEKEGESLTVQTAGNFLLYMNTSLNVEDQINKLTFMLGQDEVKETINTIKYFDLRYQDKVYYK